MFSPTSRVADVAADEAGRQVLERFLPGITAPAALAQIGPDAQLALIAAAVPLLRDDEELSARFWSALAAIESGDAPRAHAPRIIPRQDYESAAVGRGSARVSHPDEVRRWSVFEVELEGPSKGNPFVDVELQAVLTDGERQVTVGGFYAGAGAYRLRWMPDEEGSWSFETRSNARSLDGIAGRFTVTAAEVGEHGPVRVEGFHFRHADGTRYRPVGTTAYAWTHQDDELQEQTLRTLAPTAFTKLRFCVFPKRYLFNESDPARFPFVWNGDEGLDVTRFDVAWWDAFERRIADLKRLGVQADVILFHPYDAWGFSDLGPAVDERYLTYAVRRLAAFPNVWWSLANEYDLLGGKTRSDWEALAAVVRRNDPTGHLTSIHNFGEFYGYDAEWITHASIQKTDQYRTAENTDLWRDRWRKPVVIDECSYEGDIGPGWGNLTGVEMVRRCWEGAVRGGYVQHGETYWNDREELWWSKGGELVGESPARIAFLDSIIASSPAGAIDPVPAAPDVPTGGADGYRLVYLGSAQPRWTDVVLPEGQWTLDVLDTWGMTIERVEGRHVGGARVVLPGRPFMAVRAVRTGA